MTAIAAQGQVSYNFYRFAFGVGASYERAYTNVKKEYNHFSFNGSLIYNYSPFIPIALEVQKGTLSGGGLTPALDRFGRQYTNRYFAIYLHGDFELGEVIDYSDSWIMNKLKDVFFGGGFGVVSNNNSLQRYNIYPWNGPLTYRFPGKDKSINLSIPMRFGYEIRFYDRYNEPSVSVDIGYIHNLVFGEGLDGYNDPPSVFKNNATSQYRQIFLGVRYSFGNSEAFVKPIRY
ncbi:MAG TPA: hypothetical protein VHC47_03505 [Mucilaginibacter sp.]|nr:hypothetical protein [Mucilaginibacter sp.]